MTQLSNIILPEKHFLDPELAPLINKLALDKPAWTFAQRKNERVVRNSYAQTIRGSEVVDDDTFYLRAICVYEGNAELGEIGVQHHYSRRVVQKFRFFLRSWRLDGLVRGGTKTSVNMKLIASDAKRYLKAQDVKEIMADAMRDLEQSWYNVIRRCANPLERGNLTKSIVDLQMYAFCVASGKDVEASRFIELIDTLRSPECERAIAEYELGKKMENLRSAGLTVDVRAVDDHYLLKEPDSEDIVTRSFEELPVAWQERIAVLQLLKDEELVRDIGFRLNSNTYRILV